MIGIVFRVYNLKDQAGLMKRIIFTLIVLLHISLAGFSQTSIFEDITTAFNTSDQKLIAKYFNNKVELTINEQSNVFSKTQAEMILRDFFIKYPPSSFQIQHKTNPTGDAPRFAIGNLITTAGNFRIYFIIKQVENTIYLQEMRFEAERTR